MNNTKTYIRLYDSAALDAAGNPTRGAGPYKTFLLNGEWGAGSVAAFISRRPWLHPAKIVVQHI